MPPFRMDAGQRDHFLDTAKPQHSRHHPISAAALYTGRRQGVLIGLQGGDIDRHGNFNKVRRAKKGGRPPRPAGALMTIGHLNAASPQACPAVPSGILAAWRGRTGPLQDQVEQVTHDEDPRSHHAGERRDQADFQHLPEDDHLGEREGDDRHHEGEHRPQRRPLAE